MFGSRKSKRSELAVLCVLFAAVQFAEESVIGENRPARDDRNEVNLLKWTHSVWLGEALTSPRLYWNPMRTYVEFKIEANTIGGIVLSFNQDDLILLWVDDVTGKAHIEVRFSISVGTPAFLNRCVGPDLSPLYDSVIPKRVP